MDQTDDNGFERFSAKIMENENRQYRPNFGALQERVNGIEKQLKDISESVRELTRIITAASKPQYQVWGLFGTLFCTITAGAWWVAVTLTVAPLSERVKANEVSITAMVPREMNTEKWASQDRETQRLQAEIDARATKDDINRLIIELDRRLPKTK